jgi:cytochrome c nitrite reductase small subunit
MTRKRWSIIGAVLGAAIGVPIGLGAYTFIYARGLSYMTNDPAACANCHVMQGHFDAWSRSSHHAVAVCNDCHTPHDFVGKYMTKAANGYHHSLAFTTEQFHEPIQITAKNREITESACRRCHADIVQEIDTTHGSQAKMSCTRCHRYVGHWR